MKKFLKITVSIALAAAMLIAVTGCGGAKKESAYGLMYNDSTAGIATVTIDKGKITAVSFDETELPQSWAKKMGSQGPNHDPVMADVAYTADGYAKKITIGGKIYEAVVAEEKFVDYQSGNDKLMDLMKTEENIEKYIDDMANGDYGYYDENGVKKDSFTIPHGMTANVPKSERWLKSKNGYWTVTGGTRLGWKANMQKMVEYIVSYGFDKYTGDEVKDVTFKIDGVDTGATLSGFHSYMKLAKAAYDKVK